jgi:hypothetical protein
MVIFIFFVMTYLNLVIQLFDWVLTFLDFVIWSVCVCVCVFICFANDWIKKEESFDCDDWWVIVDPACLKDLWSVWLFYIVLFVRVNIVQLVEILQYDLWFFLLWWYLHF